MLNFTPHAIILLAEDEAITYDPKTRQYTALIDTVTVLATLPPTGLARVASKDEPAGTIEGWPVREVTYGKVKFVIDDIEVAFNHLREENIIVGAQVMEAMKAAFLNTSGFYRPGRQVRDAGNPSRILGCLDLYAA